MAVEEETGFEEMRTKHLPGRKKKHVSKGTRVRMREAYLQNNEFFV